MVLVALKETQHSNGGREWYGWDPLIFYIRWVRKVISEKWCLSRAGRQWQRTTDWVLWGEVFPSTEQTNKRDTGVSLSVLQESVSFLSCCNKVLHTQGGSKQQTFTLPWFWGPEVQYQVISRARPPLDSGRMLPCLFLASGVALSPWLADMSLLQSLCFVFLAHFWMRLPMLYFLKDFYLRN